jgi:hypothetical protein
VTAAERDTADHGDNQGHYVTALLEDEAPDSPSRLGDHASCCRFELPGAAHRVATSIVALQEGG